jgi:hypothetical protein
LSQIISGLNGMQSSGASKTSSSSAQWCSYQVKGAGTVCCSSRGLDKRCSGASTCTGVTAECT